MIPYTDMTVKELRRRYGLAHLEHDQLESQYQGLAANPCTSPVRSRAYQAWLVEISETEAQIALVASTLIGIADALLGFPPAAA